MDVEEKKWCVCLIFVVRSRRRCTHPFADAPLTAVGVRASRNRIQSKQLRCRLRESFMALSMPAAFFSLYLNYFAYDFTLVDGAFVGGGGGCGASLFISILILIRARSLFCHQLWRLMANAVARVYPPQSQHNIV